MVQKTAFAGDASLTEREIKVLRLVSQGLTNKQIAEELHLSEKTIEHMLGRSDPYRAIYPKINASNRAEAGAWYAENIGNTGKERTNSGDPLLHLVATHPHVLDITEDRLETTHQVRVQGNPHLAATLANTTAERLRKIVREIPSTKAPPLLSMLAQILYEQALSLREVASSPQEAWASTDPLVKEMLEIADRCEDGDLFALAYLSQGDSTYIAKQYVSAAGWFNRAQDSVTNDGILFEILRPLALSYAYLRDKKGFKKAETEARAIIEGGQISNLEQICQVLEGIGRGQGLLGSPEAIKTLEEAEDVYNKITDRTTKAPIRAIQLMRSRLEVIQCLEPTDKILLETYGEKGIRLAQEYGYHRHEWQIRNLLERLLN